MASREEAVATVAGSLAFGAAAPSFAFRAASLSLALAALAAALAWDERAGGFTFGGACVSFAFSATPGPCALGGGVGSAPAVLTDGGSTLGAAAFTSPSEFLWLRATTPVPTTSVNASGAATSSLPLTRRAVAQRRRFNLGSFGMLKLGRRILGFGAGGGGV